MPYSSDMLKLPRGEMEGSARIITKSEGPSASAWDTQRPVITRLYMAEKRPLRNVMGIMEAEFGFKATERMYKSRIKAWDLAKNIRANGVVAVLSQQEHHETQTAAVHGPCNDPARLQKYQRRVDPRRLERIRTAVDAERGRLQASPRNLAVFSSSSSSSSSSSPAMAMQIRPLDNQRMMNSMLDVARGCLMQRGQVLCFAWKLLLTTLARMGLVRQSDFTCIMTSVVITHGTETDVEPRDAFLPLVRCFWFPPCELPGYWPPLLIHRSLAALEWCSVFRVPAVLYSACALLLLSYHLAVLEVEEMWEARNALTELEESLRESDGPFERVDVALYETQLEIEGPLRLLFEKFVLG